MLYGALNSTLTRTSTDFWPTLPASHGEHLYVNAQVSAWFGEFVHPDWDMFQSGHPMGGFHAAGRAVSGGPVYVSDKWARMTSPCCGNWSCRMELCCAPWRRGARRATVSSMIQPRKTSC